MLHNVSGNRFQRLLLILSFFSLLSFSAIAQNGTQEEAVAKAFDMLHKKGYSTEHKVDGFIAYKQDSEYYEITINKMGNIPVIGVSSNVGSFSAETTLPLQVATFVNRLNEAMPFVKFTMSYVAAGDYALVTGGSPDDIYSTDIDAEFVSFFGTDEQMLLILEDVLNTFKQIKKDMPKTL